jgi:hypothetical protein
VPEPLEQGAGDECPIRLDAVVSSGTRETPAWDEKQASGSARSGALPLPHPCKGMRAPYPTCSDDTRYG